MIDLLNQAYEPTMDEISDHVRNPVFDCFCHTLHLRKNKKIKKRC